MFFPIICVLSLLLLAPYLIPLQSIYSSTLLSSPLASNDPMRISKPAQRHLNIHLSIAPFLLPSLFSLFAFFSIFSLQAKGKLAASFSLPKGLFKLETLQSPHPPFPSLPPLSLSHTHSFPFLPLSLGWGWVPLFPADSLSGPVNARQLCFVDVIGGKEAWKERGRGKVELGERELEKGQGRPVSRCTLVPSSSHGSFHPD